MKKFLFTVALSALFSFPAWADQALATSKACMACHAVDKRRVGPAFKDVATRYASDKDAVSGLAAKIVKGSRGVWGPVPMPPNAHINEVDAKKLAAWVLTLN